MTGRLRRAPNLQDATRIGGDDRVGAARLDVVGFAAPEHTGHLGLYQIEDPGAAATDVALGQRLNRDPWYRSEQVARLLAHALSVRQMAGVVIGNAQGHGMPRRPR